MLGGVYTITSPSGKQYVGSAKVFYKRWSAHRRALEMGRHENKRLVAAFQKYGLEALRFERLLVCSPEDRVFFEQRAIDILKPSYNQQLFAQTPKGGKQSPETIEKRRLKMMGHPVSAETRAKLSLAQKGRKLSEAHLAALRTGRKHTAEARAKMSAKVRAADSPERRAMQRAANLGRKPAPMSEEAKIRLSHIFSKTTREDRAAIVQMRKQGSSFGEIARIFSISKHTARNAFKRATEIENVYFSAVEPCVLRRSVKNIRRGEGKCQANLTEEKVKAIRSDARRNKDIAGEYGVSPATITMIKSRLRWSHVE